MRDDFVCPVEKLLSMISGKWKVKILRCLTQTEPARLNQIADMIPHAGKQALLLQLRELEESGMIYRTRYPEMPPRVEYSLTEKGSKMSKVIQHLYVMYRELHGGWIEAEGNICPAEVLLKFVSKKWDIKILKALSSQNTLRFHELIGSVPGITIKVLTQRLKEMEANGLIVRIQYEEMPPHVEYHLTELGIGVVTSMMELRLCGYQVEGIDMEPCQSCGHYVRRDALSTFSQS